jgi:hypothetical protein
MANGVESPLDRITHKRQRESCRIEKASPEASRNRLFELEAQGVSPCYEMTKPFDALAKGLLVPSNRGARLLTCERGSAHGSKLIHHMLYLDLHC